MLVSDLAGPGSNPGRNFNPGARISGDVQLLSLNYTPIEPPLNPELLCNDYVEKTYVIVDSDLSVGWAP